MAKTQKLDNDAVLRELEDMAAKHKLKCSKCGCDMVEGSFEILNVIQADFGHDLFVGPHKTFYLNPKRRSQVNVYVCSECGYMELYADDPSGL